MSVENYRPGFDISLPLFHRYQYNPIMMIIIMIITVIISIISIIVIIIIIIISIVVIIIWLKNVVTPLTAEKNNPRKGSWLKREL